MEEILNLIYLTKNNITDIRQKLNILDKNLDLLERNVKTGENVVIQGASIVENPPEETSILDLLNSSDWPEAISHYQILDEDSEEDKLERAEGIINFFLDDELVGKKFLDIGCGEGHTVIAASNEKASFAIGYDLHKRGRLNWEQENKNFLLTRDKDKVKKNAPYDTILIYDVVDHIEQIHPIDLISTAKSLLKPNGKIHIRFHPWCSRHGGHIYRKLNKAFAHLVLNEKEMEELGVKTDNSLEIYRPVSTYKELIEQCGMNIVSEHIEKEKVEEFFKSNSIFKSKILKKFEMKNFPEMQMEMCFVDFVLEKK